MFHVCLAISRRTCLSVPGGAEPPGKIYIYLSIYLQGLRPLGPPPTEVILKISARYDLSLLEHFRGNHAAARQWVQRVVELAKPRLSHATLNVRVQLQLVDELSHVPQRIRAGAAAMIQMKALLEAEFGGLFCQWPG
jgi:hypothetical protein